MTADYQGPTPPPELAQQWIECCDSQTMEVMIQEVARWGADQELEACCEWILRNLPGYGKHYADYLRKARRPKPPSLKEQALEALGPEPLPETGPSRDTILNVSAIERHRLIRRALERLQELENND